jgi:hypothetical protein
MRILQGSKPGDSLIDDPLVSASAFQHPGARGGANGGKLSTIAFGNLRGASGGNEGGEEDIYGDSDSLDLYADDSEESYAKDLEEGLSSGRSGGDSSAESKTAIGTSARSELSEDLDISPTRRSHSLEHTKGKGKETSSSSGSSEREGERDRQSGSMDEGVEEQLKRIGVSV